ncbi:MAG: CPBP family intramembrane metalloprotease [Lachnospiraceae bacterium]|nr:CPBP family intramembrane metalloprotease [Lachnospiraceae bacterium]
MKEKIKKVSYLTGIGVLVGAALGILSNDILRLYPALASSEAYQKSKETLYAVGFREGLIRYVLIAPLVEELIFRVLLMVGGEKLLGRKVKNTTLLHVIFVTGSALAFACYHGNIVQGIYGLVAGVLLAMMWIRGKSLLPIYAMHGMANLSAYLLERNPEYWDRLDNISLMLTLLLVLIGNALVSGKVVFGNSEQHLL